VLDECRSVLVEEIRNEGKGLRLVGMISHHNRHNVPNITTTKL
jgi:hypothetical protein